MDINCAEVIDNFFRTFGIKLQRDFIKRYPTLIDLLEDESNIYDVRNRLQGIFPSYLPQSSSLFSKEVNQNIINAFLQRDKEIVLHGERNVYPYFQLFVKRLQPYISYRRRDNEIVLNGDIDKRLMELLNFYGWNVTGEMTKNTNWILGDNKIFLQGVRNIDSNELMNTLLPPSVFQRVYKQKDLKQTKECIGFDLDGTLINQSNELLPFVKDRLHNLYQQGYNLFILSNQKRRKIGDPKLDQKIDKVTKELDVPMSVYCAREEDVYRKPNPGVNYLLPKSFGKVKYFVGDAAGRSGDHSDDDLQFAKNIGVPHYTPESYFLPFEELTRNSVFDFGDKTMIIMIGYPGSGKSQYISDNLDDYEVISRDELKTMEKCEKETERVLREGGNVVIDNVNFKESDRERFIKLGKKYGYHIIGMLMTNTMESSMHYAKKREEMTGKKIPAVVFYKLRKEFQIPDEKEGFDKIYKII